MVFLGFSHGFPMFSAGFPTMGRLALPHAAPGLELQRFRQDLPAAVLFRTGSGGRRGGEMPHEMVIPSSTLT